VVKVVGRGFDTETLTSNLERLTKVESQVRKLKVVGKLPKEQLFYYVYSFVIAW
jgi:hypothetical protein